MLSGWGQIQRKVDGVENCLVPKVFFVIGRNFLDKVKDDAKLCPVLLARADPNKVSVFCWIEYPSFMQQCKKWKLENKQGSGAKRIQM